MEVISWVENTIKRGYAYECIERLYCCTAYCSYFAFTPSVEVVCSGYAPKVELAMSFVDNNRRGDEDGKSIHDKSKDKSAFFENTVC